MKDFRRKDIKGCDTRIKILVVAVFFVVQKNEKKLTKLFPTFQTTIRYNRFSTYSFYQYNAIGFNCLRSRFHCSTQ